MISPAISEIKSHSKYGESELPRIVRQRENNQLNSSRARSFRSALALLSTLPLPGNEHALQPASDKCVNGYRHRIAAPSVPVTRTATVEQSKRVINRAQHDRANFSAHNHYQSRRRYSTPPTATAAITPAVPAHWPRVRPHAVRRSPQHRQRPQSNPVIMNAPKIKS